MTSLELLAPARNLDIGIAAIDCGADAVYIAGPAFGARAAAGNSVSDIRQLCEHAHRYGARVFATVNTIIYDDELDAASRQIRELADAGVDALIVQDLGVLEIVSRLGLSIPLHASTQCAIRSAEKGLWLASLGFSRLILERELPLETIREIGEKTGCEIEFFVHGALCVCYSGQCYLSEHLAGRSANRGACIQACRSRYDLVDEQGKILAKDKSVLSLKDYNLKDRLPELARAGVSSFKIEGRLKNISYVRNVVRDYSLALDRLVSEHPDQYRRASFGHVVSGFAPQADKTFNRGYTELYIDGRKSSGWASFDAAKGMGEFVGTILSARCGRNRTEIELSLREGVTLSNGDGFSLVCGSGEVIGFRGDVCRMGDSGRAVVECKAVEGLHKGARVFRNLDAAFERDLERQKCARMIGVSLELTLEEKRISLLARSEDGRELQRSFLFEDAEPAGKRERMISLVESQLQKSSGIYDFRIASMAASEQLPFLPASALNTIRRELATELDSMSCGKIALSGPVEGLGELACESHVDYRANVANRLAEKIYREHGAEIVDKAYELSHPEGAELMRTRYCVRKEMGMCPGGPLYIINNGRRLKLSFDCKACEMTVTKHT